MPLLRTLKTVLPAVALATALGCQPSDPTPITREAVSLDGMGYALGSGAAPVTVVEFSDFGCPYCASFALDTYPAIHAEFVETGRVRWIFVPFVLGIFPNGETAAMAAECAAAQGGFWGMHHILFQRQREWRREDAPPTLFLDFAALAGLEGAPFERCLTGGETAARLAHQVRTGQRIGMRATPSFVINGRLVEGALPYEQFRALLLGASGES
jgi:protein-disulfide isomerase